MELKQPMILVTNNGYASPAGQPDARPDPRASGDINGFEDVMLRDVIPMIDSTFRTIPDREHRAMAGLSMGGNQTCRLTTHNLDKFAYIGAFSGTMNGLSTEPLDPATAFNALFKDGAAFNEKVRLLWIGMGTEEPNPFPGAIGAFRAMLDKAGIKYVYFSSPGTAHEWLTWRRDLNDFAPRLFRSAEKQLSSDPRKADHQHQSEFITERQARIPVYTCRRAEVHNTDH